MDKLIKEILACKVCEKYLPFEPNPIVQFGKHSKIIIIGQAPGSKVHNNGIPWNDKSGDELRRWLGVTKEQFYNEKLFALVPMGFCYPGKGKSGDLPPRPECAPLWHERIFEKISDKKIIILIGQYAQKYYLGNRFKKNLTETVKHSQEFLPDYLPLVHPSPRNNIWQKKNSWFEKNLIPQIQFLTNQIIRNS